MFTGRNRIVLAASKVEGNIWVGKQLYPETNLIATDPDVIKILKNKQIGDVINVIQLQILNKDTPTLIQKILREGE